MALFRLRDISKYTTGFMTDGSINYSLWVWLTLNFLILSKCQFPTQTFSERFSDEFNLLSYKEFWEPDTELCCDQLSDKYPHWASCQNVKHGCEFLKDRSVSEGRIKAGWGGTREWHTYSTNPHRVILPLSEDDQGHPIFCEKMFVM